MISLRLRGAAQICNRPIRKISNSHNFDGNSFHACLFCMKNSKNGWNYNPSQNEQSRENKCKLHQTQP